MADPLNPRHAVYGINAYLKIGNKKTPIVSATIEFSVNQIPMANVTIPAGVLMPTGKPSDGGLFTEQDLTGKKNAQIIITGKGRPHPNEVDATPKGDLSETVIFDGYLVAKNIQFNTNGVSATVVLFHWMHDLDSSSFATSDFIKASPQDWFNADPSLEITQVRLAPYRTPGNGAVTDIEFSMKDWWKDILIPGIKYKATQPFAKFINQPSNNPDVLKALDKMSGTVKLRTEVNASQVLLPSIHRYFCDVIMQNQGGSSAFEKLVFLGRTFKFMLAPRVDKCLVIPYNPLGPTKYTLTESEFDFGFSSPNPTVMPRGVILHGAPVNRSIIALPTTLNIDSYFRGSYVAFSDTNALAVGPFFTMFTPPWMASTQTIKIDPSSKVVMRPVNNSEGGKIATDATPAQLDKEFPNRYAKAVYFETLFAAKLQEIICGFRLDIAPGDCILLKGSQSGQNVPGVAAGWRKRGFVESVTYILSGTPPVRINTVYRLRHVFDKSDIDLFGIGDGLEHPLFNDYTSVVPLKSV